MCGLAGAIRRYSVHELCDPLMLGSGQKSECKCTMLLALPRPVDASDPGVSLCNNILTPILKLPIAEPLPLGRLRRTVASIGDLKSMAFLAGIRLITRFVASVAPAKL